MREREKRKTRMIGETQTKRQRKQRKKGRREIQKKICSRRKTLEKYR